VAAHNLPYPRRHPPPRTVYTLVPRLHARKLFPPDCARNLFHGILVRGGGASLFLHLMASEYHRQTVPAVVLSPHHQSSGRRRIPGGRRPAARIGGAPGVALGHLDMMRRRTLATPGRATPGIVAPATTRTPGRWGMWVCGGGRGDWRMGPWPGGVWGGDGPAALATGRGGAPACGGGRTPSR